MTKTAKRPPRFDFVGKFNLFGGISLVLFICAVILLSVKGLNYGIDFAGGTEMQIRFQKPVDTVHIRSFVDDLGFKNAQIQKFGDGTEYLIRFENPTGFSEKQTNEMITATITKVTAGLKTTFPDQGPEVRRVDSVGPQVGSQLKRNSLLAVFYSLLVILIYIGLRFDYKYAPGAVICLFHDAILVLGILSLLGREINIQILAAVMTLIGYSLNDTIVTFDRIRENEHVMRGHNLREIINQSINDVLGRSILTVFATALAVFSLYMFAGGVIEQFAFTMAWGLMFGVYSSIYVAAPFMVIVDRFHQKKA